MPIQLFGNDPRFHRIVRRKQPRAKVGFADPPTGIDARTEDKTEVIGIDPLANTGDGGQRGDTGIA